MVFLKAVLFFSLFILFYSYIGYAILVWLLLRFKKSNNLSSDDSPGDYSPAVTLIVAAYNEATFIEEKIWNTLALDYPIDKLDILFITDGSTDGTPDIVQKYGRIRLMHEQERKGKTAAINRAMRSITTPYVIFCDANTLLNSDAIRNIIHHYRDEQTGGVAGEKKVRPFGTAGAAATEGIYWKYESALKKLDASLYTVVGAAGELFSIRTELYRPVEQDVILDDFIISLRINQEGYRIAYAPDAYAMESPSHSIREEHKRKVRISAGGFQSIVRLKELLNVFRYPVLSFQYISHRVLRWTLCPLSLLLVLATNILLVMNNAGEWYEWLLVAQVVFYVMALAGYTLAKLSVKVRIFYVPFYFVFMNVAIYEGFFRFMRKRQPAAWEKATRSPRTEVLG
ncbi:glycosyltransferase family 2 protein [Chitinophaga flava]|uniref:Glycosyl transferase n=1 Tax=Chitinophaga flava TaxID=2259036 RepID=A0A365XPS0_9BACT|nr:glycosyltransferase family 2 protein [Chitinophaga flava]RBL88011.1 glycosyl transferase [Chitinophaga flava]